MLSMGRPPMMMMPPSSGLKMGQMVSVGNQLTTRPPSSRLSVVGWLGRKDGFSGKKPRVDEAIDWHVVFGEKTFRGLVSRTAGMVVASSLC